MLTDDRIFSIGWEISKQTITELAEWKLVFARAIEAEVSSPLQAKIDELMLEYCPNEMTPEQLEEWGRNQRPVSDEEQAATDKAVAEALQAQEPVAWLDTRNGGLHLADRVSDCSDVSKLQALFAAPQPPAPCADCARLKKLYGETPIESFRIIDALQAKVAEQSALIEQCEKALINHREMTRPIHDTDVALAAITAQKGVPDAQIR